MSTKKYPPLEIDESQLYKKIDCLLSVSMYQIKSWTTHHFSSHPASSPKQDILNMRGLPTICFTIQPVIINGYTLHPLRVPTIRFLPFGRLCLSQYV